MRVVYDTRAIDQLNAIRQWILKHAGEQVADRLVDSILARCETLSRFPLRGTPRFELYPGLRTIPHRRRYSIGYLVNADGVTIVGIRSAGQDFDVLTGS